MGETCPKVTVLMPCYNGGGLLVHAINSMLDQTFEDYELLVVDDGSTDGSVEWLDSLTDRRLRLVRSEHAGLVSALNIGLTEARGQYLARMDADDIAHPSRLDKQVALLDARREISVTHSDVTVIDMSNNVISVQSAPDHPRQIVRDGLLYRLKAKPIIHPSVMMRRQVYESLGGYRQFDGAEDRDFWLRAIDKFEFCRLNEPLLRYRLNPNGISRAKASLQALSSAMAAYNYLVLRSTGIDVFAEKPELFRASSEMLKAKLDAEVFDAASDFHAAKSHWYGGRHWKGIIGAAKALLNHGRAALPDGARTQTKIAIDFVVSQTVNHLRLSRQRGGG